MKAIYKSTILLGIFTIAGFCSHAQTADSTVSPSEDSVIDLSANKVHDKETKPKHLYRMNYAVSIPFCLVATAADVYAIPTIIKSKRKITDQELAGLNPDVLSGFDRYALTLDPSQRQTFMKASDYTLPVLIITPGILAFDKRINKDWFRLLIMYYEVHSITFSIYNYSWFGPAFQNKYRPVTYYTQLPVSERNPGNNRNSMYSGHEATAIASTYFLVKVYSDYHPEIGNTKYLLYALATLPPLAEGYMRVKGLEHFPSDVLVGLVIGAACGVLVPEVHRFKNHKVEFNMSSNPFTGGGAGLGMTWHIDQKKL